MGIDIVTLWPHLGPWLIATGAFVFLYACLVWRLRPVLGRPVPWVGPVVASLLVGIANTIWLGPPSESISAAFLMTSVPLLPAFGTATWVLSAKRPSASTTLWPPLGSLLAALAGWLGGLVLTVAAVILLPILM